MNETMSSEVMVLNVINKINQKLMFIYHKNNFLTPALERLLYNTLIQTRFDYDWYARYTNLTKKLKKAIQTTQKKCICFSLNLVKLKHISHEELERLNWLLATDRFKKCVSWIVFKYFNDQCPNHLGEVFDVTTERNFQLRGSFQNFKISIL